MCIRADDQEQVGQLFSKYDLLALPVLDTDECMVGIVTVDDALDVVVDEATEDMSLMAAVNPSEKSYFENTGTDTCQKQNCVAFGVDVIRYGNGGDYHTL